MKKIELGKKYRALKVGGSAGIAGTVRWLEFTTAKPEGVE